MSVCASSPPFVNMSTETVPTMPVWANHQLNEGFLKPFLINFYLSVSFKSQNWTGCFLGHKPSEFQNEVSEIFWSLIFHVWKLDICRKCRWYCKKSLERVLWTFWKDRIALLNKNIVVIFFITRILIESCHKVIVADNLSHVADFEIISQPL